MRATSKIRGYTIIEIMIFMAVSGFTFVIAASFIANKQASSEFRQAMNSVNSQVQQIINDVNNGFYPSSDHINCDVVSGNIQLHQGTNKQGTNKGCVFMGKVLQLGVRGSNGTRYNLFTVVGRQYNDDNEPPIDFAQAKPTTIDDPFLVEKNTLDWGLQATKAMDNGAPVSSVGFFSSFPGTNGGSLASGSQNITVVAVDSTPIDAFPNGNDTAGAISNIQSLTTSAAAKIRAQPNIVICFQNGRPNQYGTLTIGGDGRRLTTNVQITNSPIAGCPS